jgi:Membrane protein involved in the export of O-antigen and teichoic acid
MVENKLAGAVAKVTVYAVITRTLSFIFKIYLSRVLGAEAMGLYQICLSIFFLFSALSASGLPTVLSRKTAELRALKSEEKGFQLVTASLIIGTVIAAATVIILLLLSPFLGKIIADSRAVPLFKIMLPAVISTAVYCIIRGWFWGTKQFAYFSITELVEEICRILFTLLLVSGIISGINGAYGIALAFTISDFTVAAMLIALYFLKGGKLVKTTEFKNMAKPALPLTAMRVFGSLVGTFLAVLLPERLVSGGQTVEEATASFGRIAGMAGPLLFAPNAIISSLAIVLIPEMSADGVKNNMSSLKSHITGGINFSVIVCGLFLAVYASMGAELTTFIFNDAPSGEYLEAAAWILVLMPINQITTSALNSLGMEKEAFFGYVVSTVFMLFSVYFLTRYIGVLSVVVANLSMLAISVAFNLYYLKKRANISFGFLKTAFLVSIFAVPSSYLARNLYNLTVPAGRFLALFTACGAAALMYVALVWFCGLADIGGFMKMGLRKFRKKKDVGG